MYGYQIVRAIQRSTGEALSFGEGCVYPLLRSLTTRGMLRTRRERVDGPHAHLLQPRPAGEDPSGGDERRVGGASLARRGHGSGGKSWATDSHYEELGRRLLARGMRPSEVRALREELEGHLLDVRTELMALGVDPRTATEQAYHRTGTLDELVEGRSPRIP